MVAHSSVELLLPEQLFLRCLPIPTQQAFLGLSKMKFMRFPYWYLAGGTALALQVGHRQSLDLDFFTARRNLDITKFERNLLSTGTWETTSRDEGTLYGIFAKAKISFIAYPFFAPSRKRLQCGTITLLSSHDIAAMKIIAVSQRGRKRDFVDLYWYCVNQGSLLQAIQAAVEQYSTKHHQLPHFLKSLVYFADAQDDPMPTLFFDADWKTVKAYFNTEVPRVAKILLKLA